MREAEIEKILVCEVKKLGGRAYKWVSPGNAGVPDRIVILPGLPVPAFVELKTCRGTLTALQTAQINRLRVFGQKSMGGKRNSRHGTVFRRYRVHSGGPGHPEPIRGT